MSMLWEMYCHSLINAMTCSRDPIFIDNSTTTSMCTWKTKEWSSTNRYLPGPASERGIFTANNSCFRSTDSRCTTICNICLYSYKINGPVLVRNFGVQMVSLISMNKLVFIRTHTRIFCSRHCVPLWFIQVLVWNVVWIM